MGGGSEKLVGKKSDKYYEKTHIVADLLNNKAITPIVFNSKLG
ncbi:hypothetical protein P618_200741 [Holospora obtusa F1]|uniref:Uncharacterized protein n=1 Tax=Holospora obtusa F1 TaxID=1399147 RepID=W6TGM3_HOLOB|nr:hypothetical protein P618_200741 [Holospora obtusa F1]